MVKTTQPRQLVSYIFPVFNEAENLELLHGEMQKVAQALENSYDVEFLFINDGSRDISLVKLLELRNQDPRIRIIDFARNYGHQLAITAGTDYAKGDAVIIMDSDLQDPPSVSLELIKKWEEGFDIVYAQRKTRKDGLFKKFTAYAFYRVLDSLADIRIPKDTGDFRLMSKRAVLELRKFKERNRFMRGIVASLGFKQTSVQFDRHERHAGKTSYPIKKMVKLALDGITSFSTTPIRFISHVGLGAMVLSTLTLVGLAIVAIFDPGKQIHGNLWLAVYATLLFSILAIFLGILGEYVGRIYKEVQNRPLYVVSEIYE